ncbi:ROK family transcriptional regulator [Catenovulum sp. SM1970]|uniref:ROK family protein n=1 Tax=Marinifaba aquimaris TaxID=2741323 RepID=UPI00157177E0|nr:ROK family transcriptional regulator [Marinifaba aquimaris]NTS78186.1 ROK family transcriptional regulator [Marinifaba aquimaris]
MKGSNSKQNKALNLRLVLSEIVTQGPISRVEISRNTHLTKQTITNMVEELLATDLVFETGIKKEGSVGKPSKMLVLNPKAAYTLAVRVFSQTLEVGLFDLSGQAIASENTAYQADSLIDKIAETLDALLKQAELSKAAILGVGLTLAHSDSTSETMNLASYQTAQALQQTLVEKLNLPTAVESTASACAAFHMLFGEAKSLHSFVYVHIGDVVEAAVVYDRKILLGQNGLTGAIGELFVTPETDDETAELGRLNDFASLSSLKSFIDQPNLSNLALAEYCQQHPDKIAPWLERSAEPMRIAIHALETLLNCQSIILGGDISPELMDKFISNLRPFIPSISQYGERQVVRLIKTPNVEGIALKGSAVLPFYAALTTESMQTLAFGEQTPLSDLQTLIYT